MNKNKSSVFWIWKTAKKQIWIILIMSLTSMLTASSYIIPALLSRQAINIAVTAPTFDEAKAGIIKCAFLFLAFIIALITLLVINSRLKAIVSGKLEMQMRHNFFETITKKQYSQITNIHSGEILNRFTSDIDVVVAGITGFIPHVLSIIAKTVVGFIAIASFSTGFSMIVLAVGLLILVCAYLFKSVYKRIHKEVQQASGVMRGFTQECVENIVVVKSFSTQAPFLKKLDGYMQKIFKLKLHRNAISNISGSGASFIYRTGYYATLCWGAFMIAGNSMDYGTLMAFMQIISQLTSPFFNASSLITQFYSALASAERLAELESLTDEKTDPQFDAEALYREMDAICAENLTFKYDNNYVIGNTSFSINKGSCVVITGPSGAGKSTLLKLILGLYPPEDGRLFIRAKDKAIDLDSSTRPMFAYVPQGNLLISGTIADNIKFGNTCISDEKMITAAKTACIYDFIANLPNGFETEIGEHGTGLSEGQIQRIAVARALCCDAPILILDECTSALDSETEEKMLQNIAALKTKTIFFISHKNAAISICDVRLNFSDGKLCII